MAMKKGDPQAAFGVDCGHPGRFARYGASADQWNCSSSVEPVSAFTLDEPPWITVVTSSK